MLIKIYTLIIIEIYRSMILSDELMLLIILTKCALASFCTHPKKLKTRQYNICSNIGKHIVAFDYEYLLRRWNALLPRLS